MNKTFIFGLAFATLAFTGCKEDEEPAVVDGTSYPTDRLEVSPLPSVLVQKTTGAWCQFCPNGGEAMLVAKAVYGERIVPFVLRTNDPLTTPTSQILEDNFPASGVPNFYINNEDAGQSIEGPIEFELLRENKIGVAHAVTKTDSAYLVDVKVQVFKTMQGEEFFVQTYLMVDEVEARNFGQGANLTQVSTVPTVNRGTDVSTWARNAAFVDGEPLVKPGDTYVHHSAVHGRSINAPEWGLNLNEINPFGNEYIEGDILGSRFTPIRMWLPIADISPIQPLSWGVATIIWQVRPGDTGNDTFYDFVNGYYSVIK